ncbi:LOW QUALITY PROTEIN: hypothetical protein CVT25_009669 [Psilocybe cyanescens]|uniref:Uncharacterized protein n=1 Tax=Psilocybe cyanescens TaxID=93625 RepID=A0A409XP02_PSICY|nr:LOW QUALITY PROTEIN: hypothetical protein CVT25_009669 [Psilocybe cyanescens]
MIYLVLLLLRVLRIFPPPLNHRPPFRLPSLLPFHLHRSLFQTTALVFIPAHTHHIRNPPPALSLALHPTTSSATLDFFTSTISPISNPTWLESTLISKPHFPPAAYAYIHDMPLIRMPLGQPNAVHDIRQILRVFFGLAIARAAEPHPEDAKDRYPGGELPLRFPADARIAVDLGAINDGGCPCTSKGNGGAGATASHGSPSAHANDADASEEEAVSPLAVGVAVISWMEGMRGVVACGVDVIADGWGREEERGVLLLADECLVMRRRRKRMQEVWKAVGSNCTSSSSSSS